MVQCREFGWVQYKAKGASLDREIMNIMYSEEANKQRIIERDLVEIECQRRYSAPEYVSALEQRHKVLVKTLDTLYPIKIYVGK
jgi:hypothetical protein